MDHPDDRAVKVFVSSTFRDMQAERDELTTRTFQRLRALCESRGIIWREVDLRWGITDEQRLGGQVIPICLAEIDSCRPYFIGMLGERYGWECFDLPEDAAERYPWLLEHRGASITEIEFEYGALRSPSDARRAFFYLLPLDDSGDETEILDHGETAEDARRQAKKLRQLKSRLLESGLPVRLDCRTPKSLGELVYADIKAAIDEDFPDRAPVHPLEVERREHESFALSRIRVYLRRPDSFQTLDQHVGGDGPPLILLGESGCGKSALLANWVADFRARYPQQAVVQYYVGASARSTDWRLLVRSFLWQFGVPVEESVSTVEALRAEFAAGLDKVANRDPVVIVIDALNQLEDRDGALDLVWLPPVLPPEVRLIISTLPGRALAECQRRAYREWTIHELSTEERSELASLYLKSRYSKTLSVARLARVTAHPLSGNPLWLVTLLEELRLYGDHDTLEAKITHYLTAHTIEELYALVLARWEEDYDRDRSNLVRDSMSAIWAARRGLSEAEIRDLLGNEEIPLPGLVWSTLHCAVDHALVERSGLFGFFHDYLRRAVERRYLLTAHHRRAAHDVLAQFFERKSPSRRRTEELPWQLAESDGWDALYRLLSDLSFFRDAWDADELDVKTFWARVEQNTSRTRLDAYKPAVASPMDHVEDAPNIATLLKESGYLHEALAMFESLSTHLEHSDEHLEHANALTAVGQIADVLGDRDKALQCHSRAERVFRELEAHGDLLVSLGEQAHIRFGSGEPKAALALLSEAERLAEQVGDRHSLHAVLVSRSEIQIATGDLGQSSEGLSRAERICVELGDRDGLQRVYGHCAHVLILQGQFSEAMDAAKKKERIAHDLGDRGGQAAALAAQSRIMQETDHLDEALRLVDEAKALYESIGYERNVADTAANRGALLLVLAARRGDRDLIAEARGLFKLQETVYRRIGEKQGLDVSLNNQARAAEDWGDHEAALDLYDRAAQAALETEQFSSYANTLCNKAQLLEALGNSGDAYETLKIAAIAFQNHQDKLGAARALRLMSSALLASDQPQPAIDAAKWAQQLARQAGSFNATAKALERLADVFEQVGQIEDALRTRQEQLKQWRKAGELDRFVLSLGKVVDLASKLGDTRRVLDALRQQADALSALGRASELREALPTAIASLESRGPLDQDNRNYLAGLKDLLEELNRS